MPQAPPNIPLRRAAGKRGERHACEGIDFFIAPEWLMLGSKRWLPNSTIAPLYNTETTDESR